MVNDTYATNVQLYGQILKLSQDANTIDGGGDESLSITVHVDHDQPGPGFVVLKTDQWALDYDDIDAFANWLKSLCT